MDANLDMGVIKLIFLRLPVKSLISCKCVCKVWHDLIKSSYFIKSQLKYSIETNSNFSLLFTSSLSSSVYHVHDLHSLSSITKLSLPHVYSEHDKIFDVIGTCNGLICFHFFEKGFGLCNPSTRKFQLVPHSKGSRTGIYGFGYDYECDDFKIVKVLMLSVWVYSMRNSSWIQAQSPDEFYCFDDNSKKGTFLNNRLHWISGWKRLQRFNLHHETWETVLELPDFVNRRRGLGVFDGCLCLYSTMVGNLEIWVMKEYGIQKSWTKLFSFLGQEGIPLVYNDKRNGVLFSKIYSTGLFKYNLEKKTIREDKVVGYPDWAENGDHKIILCMESLVPLTGDVKIQGKEIKKQQKRITKQYRIKSKITRKEQRQGKF